MSGSEAEVAAWKIYWPRVVAKLKTMVYTGPICLTAEYSDHEAVDRLIAEDLAFAQSLFG